MARNWVPFNLNHYVRAKLTPDGVRIYAEAHRGHLPKIDDEGYSEFQTWVFMNIFGEHMHIGFNKVMSMEVFFEIDKEHTP